MSVPTLVYFRLNSKAKNSPHPLRHDRGLSCPSPMDSHQKEACHAL
jgi:hypothetical protein